MLNWQFTRGLKSKRVEDSPGTRDGGVESDQSHLKPSGSSQVQETQGLHGPRITEHTGDGTHAMECSEALTRSVLGHVDSYDVAGLSVAADLDPLKPGGLWPSITLITGSDGSRKTWGS